MDHQRHRIFPQEGDRADLIGGKRRLPSPEGGVRQTALPQPQTERESRRLDEEEEQQQQQRLSRQRGAIQSSESHTQERQEAYLREEGQHISGGKNSGERNQKVCLTFFLLLYIIDLLLCCFGFTFIALIYLLSPCM